MTEKEKMLAGEYYDPLDPELAAARNRARDLCQDLNATRESQTEERRRILRALFGAGGDDVWMQPPFFCDYGSNIFLGTKCFFNFNCVVLDVCTVRIGDFTLFGPAVQILYGHASYGRDAAAHARSGEADHDRVGRLGRWRRHHPPRCHYRLAHRHRRRQRRHTRHS